MKDAILTLASKLSFATVILLGLLIGSIGPPSIGNVFIKDAGAEFGRPAIPDSVAGVARSTTQRRHIAVGTRIETLPPGCTIVFRYNMQYHRCGEVYYRPHYEGNTLVFVVVEEP